MKNGGSQWTLVSYSKNQIKIYVNMYKKREKYSGGPFSAHIFHA
jgi:hypothetical protein